MDNQNNPNSSGSDPVGTNNPNPAPAWSTNPPAPPPSGTGPVPEAPPTTNITNNPWAPPIQPPPQFTPQTADTGIPAVNVAQPAPLPSGTGPAPIPDYPSPVTTPSFPPPVSPPIGPAPDILGISGIPFGSIPQTPQPEPLPIPNTFTPPVQSTPPPAEPVTNGFAQQNTSPLDNPWGTPLSSPDTSTSIPPSPQPTWAPAPANPTVTTAPENTPMPSGPISTDSPSIPTDLSHLISNNNSSDNGQNPAPSAETLVVPPQNSAPSPDVPTVPTQKHKGIPKWLIGVGVGLLIMVAGASAYFILGIGQPSKTPTSLPAEVSKTTVKTPPPIAKPTPQPTAAPAAASGSANFGQLQGSQTPPATSAADLLKQRQQGR